MKKLSKKEIKKALIISNVNEWIPIKEVTEIGIPKSEPLYPIKVWCADIGEYQYTLKS